MIQSCRDCRDIPFKKGLCKVHYQARYKRTIKFLLDIIQWKVVEPKILIKE